MVSVYRKIHDDEVRTYRDVQLQFKYMDNGYVYYDGKLPDGRHIYIIKND